MVLDKYIRSLFNFLPTQICFIDTHDAAEKLIPRAKRRSDLSSDEDDEEANTSKRSVYPPSYFRDEDFTPKRKRLVDELPRFNLMAQVSEDSQLVSTNSITSRKPR